MSIEEQTQWDKECPAIPYDEYLRHPRWRAHRRLAMKRDGYRCQNCATNDVTLDVHHVGYERRGTREELIDLLTLCANCHAAVHGHTPREDATPPDRPTVQPIDLDPLCILVEHPHLWGEADKTNLPSLLADAGLGAIYSAAAEMQRANGQVDIARLLQVTPARISGEVAEALLSRKYAVDGDPAQAFKDCIKCLRARLVEDQITHIQKRMQMAQDRNDTDALDGLRERLVGLIKERRSAKG